MFYGQFILGKKSPLAKIWFAAHVEKKLSRNEILSTDVGSAVEEVMRPKVKLSLRLNGNLLLGIVRIYAKKASYILHDLERARKIFHHFVEEKERQVRRARRNIAGRPDESTIVEEDELMGEMEITLPQMEEFAHAPGPRFNGRAHNSDITLHEHNAFFGPIDLTYEDQVFEPEAEDLDRLLNDEIDRMSRPNSAVPDLENQERMQREIDESLLEDARRVSLNDGGQSRLEDLRTQTKDATNTAAAGISALQTSIPNFDSINVDELMEFEVPDEIVAGTVPDQNISDSNIPLDPLSSSQIRQEVAEGRQEQRRRAPRRRRAQQMVTDLNTSLDDDLMREQMRNIRDIVVDKVELAPPTKNLMLAKQMGSVAYIFNNPATNIAINPSFMKLYNDHCILKDRPSSDVPTAQQICQDLAFTEMPQLDADEREMRRSRTPSRAPSNVGFSFMDQIPVDDAVMNQSIVPDNFASDFNNAIADDSLLNMPTHDTNIPHDDAVIASTPLKENELIEEEDRENINPFAGPPAKRSRSEKELQAEEKRAKESARLLLRLIKNKSAEVGTQTLNFNELVLPNAKSPEQIRQLPEEERRRMAKIGSHQFYALLELRKSRNVQVEQAAAYAPIFVTVSNQ